MKNLTVDQEPHILISKVIVALGHAELTVKLCSEQDDAVVAMAEIDRLLKRALAIAYDTQRILSDLGAGRLD